MRTSGGFVALMWAASCDTPCRIFTAYIASQPLIGVHAGPTGGAADAVLLHFSHVGSLRCIWPIVRVVQIAAFVTNLFGRLGSRRRFWTDLDTLCGAVVAVIALLAADRSLIRHGA